MDGRWPQSESPTVFMLKLTPGQGHRITGIDVDWCSIYLQGGHGVTFLERCIPEQNLNSVNKEEADEAVTVSYLPTTIALLDCEQNLDFAQGLDCHVLQGRLSPSPAPGGESWLVLDTCVNSIPSARVWLKDGHVVWFWSMTHEGIFVRRLLERFFRGWRRKTVFLCLWMLLSACDVQTAAAILWL